MEHVPEVLRFGGFELDRTACELTRAGRRVHLAPQALMLLRLLTERPGEVVSREDIRTVLWPDETFVDFEAAVNTCISQIRFVLRDKPTAPRFIETVPRKGYRFIAPVAAGSQTPAAMEPEESLGAVTNTRIERTWFEQRRTALFVAGASLVVLAVVVFVMRYEPEQLPRLAVLPMTAADDDGELVALGNLLQESTLVVLHHDAAERFAVLARPAVEGLRGSNRTIESLRALNTAYFLDATLQRVGDGLVRVHAKVARPTDMRIVWAQDYEFPVAVLVQRRAALAREMAHRMIRSGEGHHAAGASRDEDVADLILSASHFLTRQDVGGLTAAVAKLEAACAAEPQNATARGLLALALVRLSQMSRHPDAALDERVRDEATAALRLDPQNPNAHAALGAVQLFVDGNRQAAGRSLGHAASSPDAPAEAHEWLSLWLSSTGAHDRAIDEARRLQQAQPVSDTSAALARALYVAERYALAREAAKSVLALRPDSRQALTWLWLSERAEGSAGELIALERLVYSAMPALSTPLPSQPQMRRLALLASYQTALESEHASGFTGAAFDVAVVAAIRGDRTESLEWLDRAQGTHAPLAVLADVHPAFKSRATPTALPPTN